MKSVLIPFKSGQRSEWQQQAADEKKEVLIPFKSGQRSEGLCRISLLNQWVTETLSRKLTV